MLKAKRKNVVLRIPDVDKQHYLDKGYTIYDENNTLLEAPASKESLSVQKVLDEKDKKIKELEALVEKLKADLKEAREPKKVEKEVVSQEEADEVKQVKPKKSK